MIIYILGHVFLYLEDSLGGEATGRLVHRRLDIKKNQKKKKNHHPKKRTPKTLNRLKSTPKKPPLYKQYVCNV